MRHSRPARLLGAVLLAALLLPQAALAGTSVATTAAGAGSATTAVAATALPRFELRCALVVRNPLSTAATRRVIVCRWAAPDGVAVRAYRLWRVVDAPGPRRLLATIAADQRLRHVDRHIRRGHSYTYRVVALGADGSRVALSNRVTVRVGRPAERLRFGCAFVIGSDRQGVACHWSAATRPAAARYVLWRSVDGGSREAIYRTGLDGRRGFLDQDVKPGQTIRYAVVEYARHGRVVGLGGPDTVIIPAWSVVAG